MTVLVSMSVMTRFFESRSSVSPTSCTRTPRKVCLNSSVSTLATYTHMMTEQIRETIIQKARLL